MPIANKVKEKDLKLNKCTVLLVSLAIFNGMMYNWILLLSHFMGTSCELAYIFFSGKGKISRRTSVMRQKRRQSPKNEFQCIK